MRVLIIGMHFAPEPSGNAPYTTGLAVGLAGRGHQVRVLTGVPHYPAWSISDGYDRWRSTALEDGVRVTRLRHFVPSTPTSLRRVIMEGTFGARAATQRWSKPDAVICVSPALLSTAVVSLRIQRSTAMPAFGLWVQDLYSRGIVETHRLGTVLGAAATYFEGSVANRFDGLAVVHDRFKDQAVHRLGVSADRVEVIRNWTHITMPDNPDVTGFRAQMGWDREDVVALHAGNMGVKQGLDNLVAVARLAEQRGSKVRVVLLGGGNQLEHLRASGADVQRLDFVSSLPTEDFTRALASADVLLVNERPGVTDMSVPSKLTSYYASGRPVVVAAECHSVTAGEIRLSGAGVCVAPDAPALLLVAIERLAEDQALSSLMGRRGRAFLAENLSEATALDRFESWMDKLVATRSSHRAKDVS